MPKDKNIIFFEKMYEQYYASLCAYANTYVKNADLAQDIVSETFFLLWKKKEQLKGVERVKAYLFRSIHNSCLNYLRDDDKRLKGASLTIELLQTIPTSEPNAFDSLIIKELSKHIECALESLPAQQQQAFRLKRLEHKKVKEIAQEMGIAEKTVEMHITKASKTLREKLKKFSGHPKTILLGLLIAKQLVDSTF